MIFVPLQIIPSAKKCQLFTYRIIEVEIENWNKSEPMKFHLGDSCVNDDGKGRKRECSTMRMGGKVWE
jgi:hypothetical protein